MQSILVVSLFFLPMWLVERLAPGRLWPGRSRWLIRALALNGCQALSVGLGALLWDRHFPGLSLWSVEQLGVLVGATIGYVVITFVYYWWHRARHESPLLWRTLHQIHHSPQRLELLTAFYKHPLEIVINGALSSAVLFILVGATPAQAALAVLMTGIAELIYHWNIRTPHWLGYVIQRPESHCVHHERDRHTYNYSDLPLWDILFGTFRNPRSTSFLCGFSGDKELEVAAMLRWRDISTERSNENEI